MLSIGRYYLNELYDECTRLLTAQEEKGSVPDAMLRSYQQLYREIAEKLGLKALYTD